MARIKVWKEPAWVGEGFRFEPRWMVDDGYRTTRGTSWRDAMAIACRWAGGE